MKLLPVFVLLVIGGAIVTYSVLRVGRPAALKNDGVPQLVTLEPSPTVVANSPTPTPNSDQLLPAKVELTVPFLVQAPFANWDAFHEETCEEASLLNVLYFLGNPPFESKVKGDEQLQAMVAYEESQNLGVSITLQQLNAVARDYQKITNGKVKTDVTINDIKQELANGHPVIVGAAGKILPNPFFSNGGPNYHMLVIKGYDDDGLVPLTKCKNVDADSCTLEPGVFITNDVGISQGNSFRYTYQGLYKAIHDWDPTDIYRGERSYLVFE